MVKVLKSKKGVAIESAIAFMTVILALSVLLTTLVLSGHLNLDYKDRASNQRLELDQLGTYYVARIKDPSLESKFHDYMISLEEKGYSVTTSSSLTVKLGDDTVLYITADGSGNPTAWRYSEP